MANQSDDQEDYIHIVKDMIKDLQYGSITIVVQGGRIIQIEQNKKIRLKS